MLTEILRCSAVVDLHGTSSLQIAMGRILHFLYCKLIVQLLGKKSKLIRFFDSWGRNPVFQFSLEKFGKVGRIFGPLELSDEIDRVSTSDNSTPSGAN